ncbi:ankyrin repeat domain-containing protein [Dyella humicola]|uniref:ankyrin repeat domain-containing protein n=1 Tax=Dyella humicola TaxID=2992126 RepID=UPI002251B411
MRRLWYLLVVLLIASSSTLARAAGDPAVLAAALDVVMGNLQGAPICRGVAHDAKRPDRMKLAALVAALPDPNASYPFGSMDITPLGLAALADDVRLLDSLFARGAQWRQDPANSMAMYDTAQHGSPAMIKALLRHGLRPDIRQPGGWSPIMAAAWANRLDNVTVLLEAGADVNLALPNGTSALRAAVMCKNQRMVDTLVHGGARPDAKTTHLAEERGIKFPDS